VNRWRYASLVARAWCELIRYDIVHVFPGRGRLELPAARTPGSRGNPHAASERAICDAVVLATCLYFKPVLCLQRSVCAARLLRAHGVVARLVIGYRAVPFFSHAWVEVDGRVVNDSPVYQQRLRILHTA
jgi:hypothetical protein